MSSFPGDTMPRARLIHLVVAAALITGSACGRREAAATGPLSLDEIAAAWSGGRTDPTCSDRGPRGEYLGPVPGAEHCQWPTVVRGAEYGTVTGQRNAMEGLSFITWERTLRDSTSFAALSDSLARALTASGLAAYPCPNGGHRWQRARLGVQFSPISPAADGRRRVVVTATKVPAMLPEITCPGAPTLPTESRPRYPQTA